MVAIAVYSALAIVAAVAVFLLAEWLRQPGTPAPDCPGRCAIAAGLLWPILVVGVAQWGLIAAVRARICAADIPAGPGGIREVPERVAR